MGPLPTSSIPKILFSPKTAESPNPNFTAPMSMLELITKAAAGRTIAGDASDTAAAFPLIINPDSIFPLLKPADDGSDDAAAPLRPLAGWRIPDADARFIASAGRLSSELRRKLAAPRPFPRDEFLRLLIAFVEENGEKFGSSVVAGRESEGRGDSDAARLAARVAALVGVELGGLVCECGATVESWCLLEALVSLGVVKGSNFSGLLGKLIDKKKTWLLWLCVKKIRDFQPLDLAAAMKYFLSLPPSESTKEIRSEWEAEAIKAMEKVETEKGKQAAILMAMAYDGFCGWEMVLHCLLGSSPVDGPAMAWAVTELEGYEVVKLVKYLAKWLEKYERFPGAGPCLEDSDEVGLELCGRVLSLEVVATCTGAVIDQHFAYLVLVQQEGFREVVRMTEERVRRMAMEAKLGRGVANLIENLKEMEDDG